MEHLQTTEKVRDELSFHQIFGRKASHQRQPYHVYVDVSFVKSI